MGHPNDTARRKTTGPEEPIQVGLKSTTHVSLADIAQIAGTFLTVISLVMVFLQLRENDKTNRVSMRGQLYERETTLASEEATDPSRTFNTLWALVPSEVVGHDYSSTLLRVVTKDESAIQSKNASELFGNMFSIAVFQDTSRRDATQDLRRLFLYVQTNLYHVHTAHDYKRDRVLSESEWQTWKGIVRETHAHPILLAAIWQGYEYRYFSRSFGVFLQSELCAAPVPEGIADPKV